MKIKNYLLSICTNSPSSKFGFGLVCVALALLITSSLQLFYKDYIPMSLFLVPASIAAGFAGAQVGIFVTVVGLICEIFLYSQSPTFWLSNNLEMLRISVYVIQGSLLSVVFGRVHKYFQKVISENEKAERANNVKSMFLANMSHEIRTPLISVLGYAELLKESGITLEKAKNYGNIIERTGENLLELINDILDISKVEAGKMESKKISFSINKLLDEVISIMSVRTDKKNLKLIFQKPDDLPNFIMGDPKKIRQILLNLIGNAIKFTNAGFIKIVCSFERDELSFVIQDSGTGISPGQKIHLFEVFSQGEEKSSNKIFGSGLGLSLSKQLAQQLGGDITLLNSEPNIGTSFLFQIPFSPSSELQAEMITSNNVFIDANILSKKTILLVDDCADNRFLVEKILTAWGCEVVLADNGMQAIEQFEKRKFDLILMDMQMPIMDGYTACRELVKNHCTTPIIALTAHAMNEDRDRCLAAGCSDYISKPIHKTQLFQAMKNNLQMEKAFMK